MNVVGNEGRAYNDQEVSDGSNNYSLSFGQDPSYTNFEIFGKIFVQNLLDVENAVGLKAVNITDETGQTCLHLVPVDSCGNELEVEQVSQRSDPKTIRCPVQCN